MSGNDLSRTPLSQEDKEAFLKTYRETANFTLAAKAAGRSVRSFFNLRRKDADFAEECESARRQAIDRVLGSLWDLALNGVEEPIFYQGKCVGVKVRRDEKAHEFLLERMAPDEFGRKDRTEITGKDGKPLIPEMTDIELARTMAWILTRATKKPANDGGASSAAA